MLFEVPHGTACQIAEVGSVGEAPGWGEGDGDTAGFGDDRGVAVAAAGAEEASSSEPAGGFRQPVTISATADMRSAFFRSITYPPSSSIFRHSGRTGNRFFRHGADSTIQLYPRDRIQ